MSILIRQHLPGFVSGFEPHEDRVSSQSELLALPWVARWATGEDFSRFSLSAPHLMAETHEGREWWVIGKILEGAELLTLPEWKEPA